MKTGTQTSLVLTAADSGVLRAGSRRQRALWRPSLDDSLSAPRGIGRCRIPPILEEYGLPLKSYTKIELIEPTPI